MLNIHLFVLHCGFLLHLACCAITGIFSKSWMSVMRRWSGLDFSKLKERRGYWDNRR